MRLCPSCTSIHPFWSRPFSLSHSIIFVHAVVSGLRPCPACALRRHSHAGYSTPAVRAGGVAESPDRSAQPAHNRCERAGTEIRAALFELVPAPLPLFSKAQDPLPHRSRLPGYSAPPSPLVLDGDRPPCSPNLSLSLRTRALLCSGLPRAAAVVAEAMAAPAQPTPPARPPLERWRPREEGEQRASRAAAAVPMATGAGLRGGGGCVRSGAWACDPAPGCLSED